MAEKDPNHYLQQQQRLNNKIHREAILKMNGVGRTAKGRERGRERE